MNSPHARCTWRPSDFRQSSLESYLMLWRLWTNGSVLMSVSLLCWTVIGSASSSRYLRRVAFTTIWYIISTELTLMSCPNYSRNVLTTIEKSCLPSGGTSTAQYFGSWFLPVAGWTWTRSVLSWRRWAKSNAIAVPEKLFCLWITPDHTHRRGHKKLEELGIELVLYPPY